eukprot:scaffold60928_cov68-Phaeocystis_antarctica.AAC.12
MGALFKGHAGGTSSVLSAWISACVSSRGGYWLIWRASAACRRQGRGVSGAPSCIVCGALCVARSCTHAMQDVVQDVMQDVVQDATLRVVNDAVDRAINVPAPPGSRCQSACCPCRPRSPATAYGAHAAERRFGDLGSREAGVGGREHDTARCGEARSSWAGGGPGKSTRVGRLADLAHLVVVCDLARVGIDQ